MSAPCYSGKNILVVEDDACSREALVLVLEAAGCRVASAANGREALDRLRRGPTPDLILLDLMMPVMDGWQFRQHQQQDPALAAIPVVVVSAAGDLPRRMSPLGAAALLQKPIDFDHLLDAIRPFLTHQRPGVLVVDDEPQVCKLLELALARHGFKVWLAASGKDAVETYRQHRQHIGVVLLDVQMPGLDGPWTLSSLQAIDPEVRCCFMTGNTGDYDAETLLALGAACIFQKPLGLTEVAHTLRRLLQTEDPTPWASPADPP